MPWQETCAMTERRRAMLAVTSGEVTMAAACRQAGVRRQTGSKWRARFAAAGVSGLAEQSRAPRHRPQTVPPTIREAVRAQRAHHPTWGPKQLVAHLRASQPAASWPAPSTAGDLLKQAGLVVPRRRRRHAPPSSQPLAHATAPNVVWCADCKGACRLGDGSRCSPLTISDAHRRCLRRCQALPRIATGRVQPLFAATCREDGLPDVLRTDNGPRTTLCLDRPGRADCVARLVDQTRHPPGTHPAGQAQRERAPRAHAPGPQGGCLRAARRHAPRPPSRL
jgi:transposase-like protein